MTASSLAAPLVDALGFVTGVVLYVMLVVMVWRERIAERAPLLSGRGRLPLLTGLVGVIWNVGALLSFGTRVVGGNAPSSALVALAFAALGYLPAVVVHALVQGREAAGRYRLTRALVVLAYVLSNAAAVMQIVAALRGSAVPSRPALWLLTAGFTALTAVLLWATRRQPIGRRGIWVAALAVFAVSALHFSSHAGNETWWVELVGHHASLLLALAILHQDYRFALADLFLKNAIAVLLLMALTVALLLGGVLPLLRGYDSGGHQDPRAIALIAGIWMMTAMAFPWIRRCASVFVDRAVLRRPNYADALADLASVLENAETEATVIATVRDALGRAFGLSASSLVEDPLPGSDRRPFVSGPALRALAIDPSMIALLRLRTVEAPHPAIAIGTMSGGRRLLSDDLRLLDAVGRLATRRIDSLRVAHERLDRNVREERIQQLAAQAELRALRAQLNPHFLFNALTTVGYLIQASPARALETLLRLTNVLRGVLRRSTSEFAPLEDEIDFVSSYLEIEQARFEERLSVAIDVEPAARRLRCPTLILQPIVENAVKHGLTPRRAGGRLSIAATVREGCLVIRVADTGVGFDPAAPAGVGLANVAQRLRAHYGHRASVRIESVPDRGTTVELQMPAEWSAGLHEPHARRPA